MATQIAIVGNIQDPMIMPFLDFVARRVSEGETRFTIGISSPGGSVFSGVSAYNALRGYGVEVTTHNLGHVHSIAVPIFCAGSVRLATPTSRFLIHDISWGFGQGYFSEVQLREALEGLRADRHLVAAILADTTDRDSNEFEEHMRQGLTIGASDAVSLGLVTGLATEVFDSSLPTTQFSHS